MSLLQYQLLSSLQKETLAQTGRDRWSAEQQFHRLFDLLIEHCGVNKTLEIGAYEASFSRRSAANKSIEQTIAFEANPHVFAKYKDDCTAAGVDYRNMCVGSTVGTVGISIPKDFNGKEIGDVNQIASLMKNERTETHDVVQVPASPLDQAIDIAPDDMFALWVDVEGATSEVLPASEKVLEQTALVLIEVESSPFWENQWLDTDVYTFMSDHGFSPVARDLQRPNQYNVIYEANTLQNHRGAMKMVENYTMGRGRFQLKK